MPPTSKEAKVILALEAIRNDKNLSLQAATKLYNVLESTLNSRRASISARRNTTPNSRRLTDSEEKVIIQYVLELALRSFLLRLYGIEDIANQLLHVCDAPPIGKL